MHFTGLVASRCQPLAVHLEIHTVCEQSKELISKGNLKQKTTQHTRFAVFWRQCIGAVSRRFIRPCGVLLLNIIWFLEIPQSKDCSSSLITYQWKGCSDISGPVTSRYRSALLINELEGKNACSARDNCKAFIVCTLYQTFLPGNIAFPTNFWGLVPRCSHPPLFEEESLSVRRCLSLLGRSFHTRSHYPTSSAWQPVRSENQWV